MKKACRQNVKCSAINRQKWYLGSPIHIKQIFIILDMLFMNIIINQYIPLVLNKIYIPIILPCLFPYVTTEIIIKVPWLQGCALRLYRFVETPLWCKTDLKYIGKHLGSNNFRGIGRMGRAPQGNRGAI